MNDAQKTPAPKAAMSVDVVAAAGAAPSRLPGSTPLAHPRPADSRTWRLPNGDPPPLILWGDEK